MLNFEDAKKKLENRIEDTIQAEKKEPIHFPSTQKVPEFHTPAPLVPEMAEEAKAEETKEIPEYMRILNEHGGLESNIGIGNKYWKIRP